MFDALLVHATVATSSLDGFLEEVLSRYESPSLVIVDAEASIEESTKLAIITPPFGSSPEGGESQAIPDEQRRVKMLAERFGAHLNYSEACQRLNDGEVLTERSDYVVLGTWPVDISAAEAVRQVALQNATQSMRTEAACKYFLVYESTLTSGLFFLVEAFASQAGFSAHLDTEHFKAFAEIARPAFRGSRELTIKGYGIRISA
jgi:quinol monooxygenase YgiN